MFDLNSLILIAKNDSIQKAISGFLYIYISDSRKKCKKYETVLNDNTLYNNKNEQINKWLKYFCFIKTNILYIYEIKGDIKPSNVLLLESCKIKIVIKENNQIKLENNDNIIEIKLNNKSDTCKYFFHAEDEKTMKKWFNILSNSKYAKILNDITLLKDENDELKNEIENLKKLNEIDSKNKDIEINNLINKIDYLKNSLEKTITKNKRLQIASEVNIKCTDEILEKKTNELEIIHNELNDKIEENKKLKIEVDKAKEISNDNLKSIKDLKKKNNELYNKLNKIITTYEKACEEPEKIALINYNTNERYQKIVLDNKLLKEEINKLHSRFYILEDKYKQKMQAVKEVVEIGDIFDYLHKLILLCQTKIKFYEKCYTYDEDQENEIKNNIDFLIKQTKLSEANARVSYIKHRSKILEEKLSYYLNHVPPSDYFYFALTTIKRLGWVFGEIEILNPLKGEYNEVYPLFTHMDNTLPIKEEIYYNEGIEGMENYNIVNDVDIYRFPIKMCPYEEKILTDNNYNYIKIKLQDLKKDFNILKKKKKDDDDISELCWNEIKQNAFRRLEKNMILIDKKIKNI